MKFETTSVDGRTLAYCEGGDHDGYPVLFFHGNPGSRLIANLMSETATDLGIRLIALDRPGMGRSENRPARTIPEWADQVTSLIDTLDLARYSIVAHSAGGPYALACAADAEASKRLDSIGLLSGIAPPDAPRADMAATNRLIYQAADRAPWLLRPTFRLQARLAKYAPPAVLTQAFSDREVGKAHGEIDPAVAEVVKRDLLETFALGIEGVVRESVLLTQPWGIDISAVDVPVQCRYGEDDTNVPPIHGRYLAEAVLNGNLAVLPDIDHLSIITEQAPKLFEELIDYYSSPT